MKSLTNFGKYAFLLAFWLLLDACRPKRDPSPQGIAIRVTDATTKKGINGAEVTIISANKNDSKPTGSDGVCNFEGLGLGKYVVSVSVDGYKPQSKYPEVSVGEMSPVSFQLEALPMLEVNPIAVNFNNSKNTETVYFKNRSSQGDITLNLEGFEKWLNPSETTVIIPAKQQKGIKFVADNRGMGFGSYSTKVILNYRLNGSNDNTDMTAYLTLSNPQAPSIETNSLATGITQTSADITGIITNLGGSPILQRGICWSEGADPKPETDPKEALAGGELGRTFTLTAKNLKEGQVYYARVYAINASGTAYGNVVRFTTATTPTPPSVTIEPVKNITLTTAVLSGKISNPGGSPIKEQGFCWNTTGNPKIKDNKIPANTDINNYFGANMQMLAQGLVYYVRAYAINDLGEENAGYSHVEAFKPLVPTIPSEVTTLAVTDITDNSAKLQGSIVLGSSPIVQHGFCWSTTNAEPNLNDKTKVIELGALNGANKFNHILLGLNKGTNYYVKAYVTPLDGSPVFGDTKELITTESGLQLYYPFNGNFIDMSSNGNSASATSKFTGDKDGNQGRAYDLTSGPLIINNRSYLGGFKGELSIAVWAKINASNFNGEPKHLISKFAGCYGRADDDGYYIYTDPATKTLSFYVIADGNKNVFPLMKQSELANDKWHHIVFTKSGKNLRFYLDGNFYAAFKADFDTVNEPRLSDFVVSSLTEINLRIGNYGACGNTTNFNGQIDEFRIYNYSITDAQVEELFKR